jgi:hypothetical protein
MPNKVYVLGAGSSKAVAQRAPLNDELLQRALDLNVIPVSDGISEIHRFLAEFYPGFPAQNPSLEDLLSQLDLAINEGRPISRDYPVDKLRELRDELVYTIAEVLRQSLNYDDPADSNAMALLQRFVSSLQPADALVSLNYDIIIDNALLRDERRWYNFPHAGGVDYGVSVRNGGERWPDEVGGNWDWRPYQASEGMPALYKPHGSLNWLYCPFCQRLDVTAGKSAHYVFRDDSLFCSVCGGPYEALIITPTLFKSYSNSMISEIWRSVEGRIALADEIVFIGYSLPDADIHFRCMLTRALFRNRQRPERHGQSPDIRILGRDSLGAGTILFWRSQSGSREV